MVKEPGPARGRVFAVPAGGLREGLGFDWILPGVRCGRSRGRSRGSGRRSSLDPDGSGGGRRLWCGCGEKNFHPEANLSLIGGRGGANHSGQQQLRVESAFLKEADHFGTAALGEVIIERRGSAGRNYPFDKDRCSDPFG